MARVKLVPSAIDNRYKTFVAELVVPSTFTSNVICALNMFGGSCRTR